MTLTPNGHAVRSKATNAWSFLSEIELIHEPDGKFGTRVVALGCHPLVASYCLLELIVRLQRVDSAPV